MDNRGLAKEVIVSRGGIAKSADFVAVGIRAVDVVSMCNAGYLERVRHGCYSLAEKDIISEEQLLVTLIPEDAFSILEAIAEINGYRHRLKKWKVTANEQRDESLAQEISEQHRERVAPFAFSMCNISIGEQIEFCCNSNEHSGATCEVVDDKHVVYNGETWSLTALAKYLTGTKSEIAGPKYFKYKGEWLNSIRYRLGV